MPRTPALLLIAAPQKLVSLGAVDIAIIALYFVMVLGIGLYLRRYTTTGEDFFLAGRDVSAWVAGLSFLAANLGSLELMGWAAAAYQYGILATHWYWIGAIPAMLFLGIVMMPFYYISKTHSVPGYLKFRFGEPSRAFSAVTFAVIQVKAGPMSFARFSTSDREGIIRGYVGEGEFTDDSLATFGGAGVVRIPHLQKLLRYICERGFEHHVTANLATVAGSVHEATTRYLGREVDYHDGATQWR